MDQPVVMYSTPTCPYCVTMEKLLQKKGISYVKEMDIKVLDELKITTVPQLKVGDQILPYYDSVAWVAKQ